MRAWFGFDNTKRVVYARQFDLRTTRFRWPSRRVLIRMGVGSSAMAIAAGAAYHFEQFVVMGIAIFGAIFIALWQLAFYGTGPTHEDEESLDAVRFYGKGTLIFLACFWTVLIGGVALVLFLKARAL